MSNKLLHTKVSKRKPLDNFPNNNEGHNGDMQIVSIKGKGTYLCIRNKGQWEISDKFNSRNKFDTHEFDSIKSQKIYGKSGLNISLKNESISTNTYAIKTAATSTESQPLLKIGNGSTPGVLSSLGDQDLLLKTGNSTSSNILITDGANGSITNAINGYGKFDVVWNSDSSSAGKLGLLNINTGNAYLAAQVSHGAADAYVRYAYLHDTPSNSEQWVTGFDGTDGSFKINYLQDDAALTPSNGSSKLTIDTSGNVATAGTLTIGDINTDSAGDNYLVEVSGVVKKRTPAQTLSDLKPGLDDLSDVTYSSGDLTISSLDTIIAGALVVNSSGDITLSADGGNVIFDDGTNSIFDFDVDGVNLKIMDDADSADYFNISVGASGVTTLSTVDDGAAVGHLTLDVDGDVVLDPASGSIGFYNNGSPQAAIDTAGAFTNFTMFEDGGATINDYFKIAVGVNGATTLSTKDAAGVTGHLTINPDGDIVLDSPVKLPSGTKLYLDGGGDTFIVEEAADLITLQVGGAALLGLAEDATTSTAQSSKILTGCPVLLKDVGGVADTPNGGWGSIYVNSDTLYFKDDGGNVSNITAMSPIVSAMVFG